MPTPFDVFNKRNLTIPQPKNPLDKCTVVSCLPKDIYERKHTIAPGHFRIKAAPKDGFSILVVESSSWWKEMEEGQPYLEIPNSSIQVAESIVNDYCNGLLGCNMGDKMPGLFYVPGPWTEKSIFSAAGEINGIKWTFIDKLAKAQANQRRWYEELVTIADIMWARSNGNPLSISDDARYGAQILGLKDKPWLKDFQAIQLNNCPACGSLVNFEFPICANCKHIINKEKAKELNLVQAS